MTETKRKVGRPRKKPVVVDDWAGSLNPEPKNPDCEPATKGFVKCAVRKYDALEMTPNLNHARECAWINLGIWITLFIAFLWMSGNSQSAYTLELISVGFVIHSLLMVVHTSDAMSASDGRVVEFFKKYESQICEKISLEINIQPGYADLIFTNPKTKKEDSAFRLNPRELIATRDLLLKHFPTGSEPK